MNVRRLLFLTKQPITMNHKNLAMLTACVGAASAAGAATKPNLLIIHTDEHNFRTLSCYQEQLGDEQGFVWGKGVNVKTPNLDRIANEGAISNRHYCSVAVSTPSRASLITGLYAHVTGATHNDKPIREDIPTFATILRDNGYATAYAGKWHLSKEQGQYRFGIEYKAGFEDNRYMMTGGHSPYFIRNEDGTLVVAQNYKNTPQDQMIHLTDYFTDCTVELIDKYADKPFCIMVSIPDPHTPDVAKPPYDKMFDDMKPEMPFTMQPENAANRPQWAFGNKRGEMTKFDPKKLKQYFGMVKHIDDSVGEMLAALERNKVLDNTIVIFTADHGDMFYEHSRMNKGVPYDASVKIPFIIRYPKAIKAGKVVNSSSVNCDVAPTVLSMMGVKYDPSIFHGIDMSDDFTSKTKIVNSERLTHAENNYGSWALVGDDRYKLILCDEERPWLIDLQVDPYELKNFYDDPKYKSIVDRLQPELVRRLESVKSPYMKDYIYK